MGTPIKSAAGGMLAWAVLGLAAFSASAEIELDEKGELSVYGDFRARLEYDWDSRKGNGTDRDERGRMRVRARLGFNYRPDDHWQLGLRARTAAEGSQQSPHITIIDFDDNSTGDGDFFFDKYFLQFNAKGTSTWVGRNSLPWWHQDELDWDDDITPAGIGFTWKAAESENSNKLTTNLGYFTLPDGMTDFRGNLALVQLVWNRQLGGVGMTLAGGYLGIDADVRPFDDPNTNLLPPQDPDAFDPGCGNCIGNGNRDYKTLIANLQLRMEAGARPLVFGFDYLANIESYSASDPDVYTVFHRDDDRGWNAMLWWGDIEDEGHWLLGVYYTHLEALALNNSYTQDDWVRWGNAVQTRGSNLKGTEFRFAYAFSRTMSLVTRFYFVEGVELNLPTDVAKEDGNRGRTDFNFKF